MGIPSHYEINVSKNGIHFFTTNERSIITSQNLNKVYPVILEKFPKSEGYKVSVTYWECSGTEIDKG